MTFQFEQRVVAFIDVLGFGVLVDAAAQRPSALSKLNSLVNVLSSAIPVLDGSVTTEVPTSEIPKHIYISDSIILSAPRHTAGASKYHGLSSVVMRSIQVAQSVLDEGFLVRGGIDIGPAWHGESNIVGPAYQNAYRIECTRKNPGIELSPAAATEWEAGPLAGSSMCRMRDGRRIVNVLEEFYFPTAREYGGIEATYARYKRIVSEKLGANLPESANAKWTWFDGLLADAMSA